MPLNLSKYVTIEEIRFLTTIGLSQCKEKVDCL